MRIVLLAAACLCMADVAALPASHSPFFPWDNYTVNLASCVSELRTVEQEHPPQGEVSFLAEGGLRLILHHTEQAYFEQTGYTVRLTHKGESILPLVHTGILAHMAYSLPQSAICSDLNGDGMIDFVTEHWRHGNGLGAELYDRLVVLSSTRGYRLWVVPVMTPSAADFVKFGSDQRVAMITTRWINTSALVPRPAQERSYYVYDVWSFADGEIVLTNEMEARFPKWVRMTLGENHKPARSLSEADKQKLLAGDSSVPREVTFRP